MINRKNITNRGVTRNQPEIEDHESFSDNEQVQHLCWLTMGRIRRVDPI